MPLKFKISDGRKLTASETGANFFDWKLFPAKASNLVSIDFSGVDLSKSSNLEKLIQAITQSQGSLTSLILKRCNLADENLQKLVDALKNNKLITLNLEGNNIKGASTDIKTSIAVFKEMGKSGLLQIIENSGALEKLNLGGNKNLFLKPDSPFIASLFSMPNLNALFLENTGMSSGVLNFLAARLEQNHTLHYLDLRNNANIKPENFKFLAHCLEGNNTLGVLLCNNPMSEKTREDLTKLIRRNKGEELTKADDSQVSSQVSSGLPSFAELKGSTKVRESVPDQLKKESEVNLGKSN
jgi:hypothetical protein